MAQARKGRAGAGAKKPAHRPPFDWSPEIEAEILTRIMKGESVATICGEGRDDFTPGEVTFYKHLAEDDDFAKRYARAREAQAHREFDEIMAVANAAQPETVAVARLQIDAMKWRASKLAPKVYGDRQAVELTGNDGGPIQTVDPTKLSTEALREIMGAMNETPDADRR